MLFRLRGKFWFSRFPPKKFQNIDYWYWTYPWLKQFRVNSSISRGAVALVVIVHAFYFVDSSSNLQKCMRKRTKRDTVLHHFRPFSARQIKMKKENMESRSRCHNFGSAIHWNKALWLVRTSHMTWNIQ